VHDWKPWEQATGPRSPEGKARAARNAFKGAQRAEVRQLRSALDDLLRDHRELVKSCARPETEATFRDEDNKPQDTV
jgi:hypothetical protein